MRRSTHLPALCSSALLCSLVSACSSSEEGVAEGELPSIAPASDAKTPRLPLSTQAPARIVTTGERCQSPEELYEPKNAEVLVYFGCVATVSTVYSFARPVDPAASLNTRLDTAVAAYFAGPRRREGTNYFTFAGPEALNSTE